MIGDFGVPIAIFLMIVVDININDTYTQVGLYSSACSLCLSISAREDSFHIGWIYHTLSIRVVVLVFISCDTPIVL